MRDKSIRSRSFNKRKEAPEKQQKFAIGVGFENNINHWVYWFRDSTVSSFLAIKFFRKISKRKLSRKISLASDAVKETTKISNYLKIYSIHLLSALLKPLIEQHKKGWISFFPWKRVWGVESESIFPFNSERIFRYPIGFR